MSQDLHQSFERGVRPGATVRALHDLLRQKGQQITKARASIAVKSGVVFVGGVHLPALAVEATAPGRISVVDQLWFGNTERPGPIRWTGFRDQDRGGGLDGGNVPGPVRRGARKTIRSSARRTRRRSIRMLRALASIEFCTSSATALRGSL